MTKINITIPAYNEETVLKNNALKLAKFCAQNIFDDWLIVISDNNSTDATPQICQNLTLQNHKIKCLNLKQKGKGLAIKSGWKAFPADYYIFMDADLSTNLEALPQLLKELKNGADIATGSRLLKDSKTSRSFTRNLISRIFRIIVRLFLKLKLTDFACGFKGVNQTIITKIVPLTQNQEWFWDTEMLYLADKNGLKIKEIPVQWTETPDKKRQNSLNIFFVAYKYLKAISILRITRR